MLELKSIKENLASMLKLRVLIAIAFCFRPIFNFSNSVKCFLEKPTEEVKGNKKTC